MSFTSKNISFLNNGLREEYSDVELVTARLLNIFSLICLFYTMVMGVFVLLRGDILLGVIDLIIAFGYVATLVYFGVTKNSSRTAVMVVVLLCLMEIFLLLFGGRGGTGYLWFYAYPLTAFMLLGDRKGAFYNFLFLVPMALVFYLLPYLIEESPFYQYDALLKSRVLITYTGISFLTFIFSYIVKVYTNELEKAAKIDILTQLSNRRDMRDKFAYLWEYNKRQIFAKNMRITPSSYKGCSLAIVDIDSFKQVNDTYGHAVGDLVLQKIAETFKHSLRAQDIVARWGGEEFLILLPDTGVNGALTAFEKVRQSVEDMQVQSNEKIVKITVSMGYVTCDLTNHHFLQSIENAPNKIIDQLITVADQALYQAKTGGRNRIRLAKSIV